MPTTDLFNSPTPAERMSATLTIMGASGWLKTFRHAQAAYDPYGSILYAVFDNRWYGEEDEDPVTGFGARYNNEVVCADWRNIVRLVQAAGRDAADLHIPGDCPSGNSVPGVESHAAATLSWAVTVPRAPWEAQEGDAWFTPMSGEGIEYAINSGDPLWRALWDEIELNAL